MREVGRVPRVIPASMASGEGYMLAQVWNEGEPISAVPVDQILISPGNPIPDLMVPRGGKFWMRVIDPAGKVLGESKIRG